MCSIPKLATMFMLANFQDEDAYHDWKDWDWQMEWIEFQDVIVPHPMFRRNRHAAISVGLVFRC